ncbi:MAG: transposase [Rhodobacteraceae bacterium]|nr:transposase [Paracoccaceae bacterium]
MTRRKFSREFKIEAVKLVTERGVSVAQACRDLELAESVLRRWREATVAPATAFPGNGQQRPELAEIAALKKEVAKLKAERDILKKPSRAAAHLCAVKTACAILQAKGSCRWLIGGLDPVKKRGTWADAHLRVATSQRRRSRLGR